MTDFSFGILKNNATEVLEDMKAPLLATLNFEVELHYSALRACCRKQSPLSKSRANMGNFGAVLFDIVEVC